MKPSHFLLVALAALLLAACGGGGSSSGGGANAGFPGDIIGERIEFTVTEQVSGGSVGVGLTVVYDFSADGRVQGTNPATGQVLEPIRYEYRTGGNNATVLLYYAYSNGGEGFEEYKLVGKGSIMQGSYDYEATVTAPSRYSAGRAKGRYRIVPPNNVSVYAAPNATDVPVEQQIIWESMTRNDDLSAVATHAFGNAYVAITKEGTLVADTTIKERRVQGSGPSPVPVTLLKPPAGKFTSVEVYQLMGIAIDESQQLWRWSGESNWSPRVESGLSSPVHGLMEGSFGDVAITGTNRSLECLCLGLACFDFCRFTTAPAPGVEGIDRAFLIDIYDGLSFLYSDVSNGLLDVYDGCTGLSCNPPLIPAGLGSVIDFAVSRPSFIVAIETTGQVVAWNWVGDRLAVPSELSDDAVSVAVGGNYVAVVQGDGTVVTWRYVNGEVEDVDVPSGLRDITKVESTPYPGNFFFLK